MSWRDAASRPIAKDLPVNAIPGVLEVYDLPDVVKAIAPRRVDIVAPVDPVGVPLRQAAFDKLVAPGGNVHYAASVEMP